MSIKKRQSPRGLILLVVLGMLSLFSMLAISYVVFSSQSRASNFGMARSDYRGTPPPKLIDQAVKIVLRGTNDSASAIFRHDLLGDLYGQVEQPFILQVRERQLTGGSAGTPIDNSALEQPTVSAGTFVRIPFALPSPLPNFLKVSDVWTGRVLTFLEGPLRNQSFRVVRSIGDTTSLGTAVAQAQAYAVVIDLASIKNVVVTATVRTATSAVLSPRTQLVSDWIANDFANLFYQDANGQYADGWAMQLNAAPYNGHGAGVTTSGATQGVRLLSTTSTPPGPYDLDIPSAPRGMSRGNFPVSLQPNLSAIEHQGVTSPDGSGSDSDESYDAPDYNNFFLYHRFDDGDDTTAPFSHDIIPSFHRAALINYVVNESDPKTYSSAQDLIAVLQRIQAMTGRPLSYVIRRDANPLTPTFAAVNPNFSGSNGGAFPGVGNERIPQLNVIFDSNWATSGVPLFQSWIRQLTSGPWDVDNDDDGLNDSVWIDPNLPLITSAEGKLLKMLVAYQIEDLDGRLDMNAVGDLAQTYEGAAGPQYATGTTVGFGVGATNYLSQGFGYGPAETSLRHLFPAPTVSPANNPYENFLRSRYRSASATTASIFDVPGNVGDDLKSILGMREVPFDYVGASVGYLSSTNHRWRYRHETLPGLPLAVHGRQAVGLDLFGNPGMVNGNDGVSTPVPLPTDPPFDEGFNDPYETLFASGEPGDSAFTFADWERMERLYDQDRAALSRRLNSFNPNFMHLVTPRSRHLRYSPLASNRVAVSQSSSFYDMMKAIAAMRPGTPSVPTMEPAFSQMFSDLFPFEFGRAEGLNLNRPLGNGIDDDNDGQFDEPQELAILINDGIDNDSDGTTDGPSESQQSTIVYRNTAINDSVVALSNSLFDNYLLGAANLDPTYDSVASVQERKMYFGSQTRQLLARHLYCLAMFILPDPLTPSNRASSVTLDERARLLAQWAVNVVDYRDADAVMTRFPYDPQPFDASGKPGGVFWYPEPHKGEVVWGMEQPEVVMTETFATHDVRARDTSDDSTGKKTDDPDDMDYDQLRLPEGSAFIELKALRTTGQAGDQSLPGIPPTLYRTNIDGRLALNLGAYVSNIDDSLRFPIWRIGISKPHTNADANNSALELSRNPNSRKDLHYQFPNAIDGGATAPTWPAGSSYANGLIFNLSDPQPIPVPQFDRVVWFTDASVNPQIANLPDVDFPNPVPMAGPDRLEYARSRVFNNRFGDPVLLEGGQHLVIGPRAITYFGSKTTAGSSGIPENRPNNHRIVLQNNVRVSDSSAHTPVSEPNYPDAIFNWATVYDGTSNTPVPRRNAFTVNNNGNNVPRNGRTLIMRASTVPPSSWVDPDPPTYTLPTTVGFNVSAPLPYPGEFYPQPTAQLNSLDTKGDAYDATMNPDGNDALGFKDLPADGYRDYGTSTGSLPGEPFDNETSSYPLGNNQWPLGYENGIPSPGTQTNWCTAFLQRLADPERPWHQDFNPYITVDWMPIDLTVFSGEENVTASNVVFASRQKTGGLNNVSANLSGPLPAATLGKSFFAMDAQIRTTPTPSGTNPNAYFSNSLPLDDTIIPRPTTPASHFPTLGYLNSTFTVRGDVTGTNPFVAGFEGVPDNVPASALWLNRQFANVYEMAWVPMSSPGQFMQEFSVPTAAIDFYATDKPLPFTHLLNWFQQPANANITSPPAGAPTAFVAPAAIFELVSTPSPWADAFKHIPAGAVNNSLALASLGAPYNRVSEFTEPGRVNINTISDPRIWQGLMWNIGTSLTAFNGGTSINRTGTMTNPPFWDPSGTSGLGFSLRGYVPSARFIPNPNPRLHPDSPTQFAGVFKSSFEAGFVPKLRNSATLALDATAAMKPVNTTLARNNNVDNASLFALQTPTPGVPRNALEDFQYFARLANLTTTRSNVFAIHVTVGFFEYDAASGLGPEYGADRGTSRRHRGFYVIDRSIPVGYREGHDLNTDNCILLRRIIE